MFFFRGAKVDRLFVRMFFFWWEHYVHYPDCIIGQMSRHYDELLMLNNNLA